MAKAKSANQPTLTVTSRSTVGKRRVKRLRLDGQVPGVVYGKQTKPVSVTVNRRDLQRLLQARAGERALVSLHMTGDASWEKPALVHALQHDPLDGHVLHVDFHAVVLTERLKLKIPVVLTGEAVGVKQEGGVLEHFLRQVEVECLPTEIPTNVSVEISGLKIGQTVHVSDLTPPKGSTITSDPNGVIASIQMPKEEKPEEAAEAVTEPEVIREKKEETDVAGEPAKAEPSARPGSEGRAGEPKKETKAEK